MKEELEAYNFVFKCSLPQFNTFTIAAANEAEAKEVFAKITSEVKDVEIVQFYPLKDAPQLYNEVFPFNEEAKKELN